MKLRGWMGAVVLLCAAMLGGWAEAQENGRGKRADWLLPLPEVQPDPKIPTLAQVVGHRWGEDISSHAEIERYCQALAKAAPDRCRLVPYGRSYEGKALHTLIISSESNLSKLETFRQQNLMLADPRRLTAESAEAIAADNPAVVWLAYCVHGNEASPSDAALLTAYHLLADQRPGTRELLDKLIVILDPLQNPDGRDRFVLFHRDSRGTFDQDHPLASERAERWPVGRLNHYLFDMNRDWYLHTQKETAARVAAYLQWKPQVFVDAHEMGPDTSFFFDPSTDPYNTHVLKRQKAWQMTIGKHHAEQFDRHGFAYTTREMFDGFGPQYGSTWPILHGSIGILWEQAGARGRVVRREDDTALHYHDGVRQHYLSGIATLEAAARERRQLLQDFHATAADSIKLGETGPLRGFVLLRDKRPARAEALAQMLLRNGIEVRRTTAAAKATAKELLGVEAKAHDIPVGSFYVPLHQPASRLALTLLERHQTMGAEYIKRQEDRVKRGLPDEIYDATSWSLPLAYDVPCLALSGALKVGAEPVVMSETPVQGRVIGKQARVGYLIQGDDDCLLPAMCQLLREGYRAHVLSEPTRVQGVAFGRGSVLLRVAGNPDSLHQAVAAAARTHGATFHAVDSAFVDEGASLGGPNVHYVKPPRVLLAVDRPTSSDAGHTWYLFDQVWRYPVTRIAARSLPQADFGKFDVCILPHGDYSEPEAPNEDVVRRLKEWVHGGGTLVLVGGAAAWATEDKVKLLPTRMDYRKPDEPGTENSDKKEDKERKDKRPPLRVPGAFLKTEVDNDHFVTWTLARDANLHFNGDRFFHALKEYDGKNLITFAERDLLVSGYCWPQTLDLLPGKAFLMYRPLGRGHVIAFADDPNHRAGSPPLQRLFFNAVFFNRPNPRD